MNIWRKVFTVAIVLLLANSLPTMYLNAFTADKTATIRCGLIQDTAYAYYLPNGILNRIEVYHSGIARVIHIVHETITQAQLDMERRKYNF